MQSAAVIDADLLKIPVSAVRAGYFTKMIIARGGVSEGYPSFEPPLCGL
jgi:hypothetical protein